MATSHGKTVKHFDLPGHVHELTFSCSGRMSLLTNELWREMLSEAVDRAMERHLYKPAVAPGGALLDKPAVAPRLPTLRVGFSGVG
jgi:hypothetical protein